MLVMILRKRPKKWKGVLSRWMVEVHQGIFLGNPSARIRDELWKKLIEGPPIGYVAQIWSSPTPQGYQVRQYGEDGRQLMDFEGLFLLRVQRDAKKNRKARM